MGSTSKTLLKSDFLKCCSGFIYLDAVHENKGRSRTVLVSSIHIKKCSQYYGIPSWKGSQGSSGQTFLDKTTVPSLNKMSQQPVQLNLKTPVLGNPPFSWADYLNGWCEKFCSCVLPILTGIFPGVTYTQYPLCFPCKKGVFIFVANLYVMGHADNVSPNPSFLKALQGQFSQLFLLWPISHSSDLLCGPSLDPLHPVHIFFV